MAQLHAGPAECLRRRFAGKSAERAAQPVQKTTRTAQATANKARDDFYPRYPQSGPQYPWASPIPRKLRCAGPAALRRGMCLDLETLIVRRGCNRHAREIRPYRREAISSATLPSLSNVCPQTYPQADIIDYLYEKPAQDSLTNCSNGRTKNPGHFLIKSLQTAYPEACSEMLPRYSQAVPQ